MDWINEKKERKKTNSNKKSIFIRCCQKQSKSYPMWKRCNPIDSTFRHVFHGLWTLVLVYSIKIWIARHGLTAQASMAQKIVRKIELECVVPSLNDPCQLTWFWKRMRISNVIPMPCRWRKNNFCRIYDLSSVKTDEFSRNMIVYIFHRN